MQSGSLADGLAEKSSIYIKSYGTGLATPSFRGTGANHTKVNWYGLNLNSPMLGVFDLNLMPLFLIDNISIGYGNAGLKSNSGALGGSITLSAKDVASDTLYKIKAMLGAASFGQRKGYLSYHYRRVYKAGGSLDANTSVYFQTAKNDFPYLNVAKQGGPVEIQKNAEMYQLGIMEDVQWRIDSRNTILATLWYQKTDRKLPGLMTSAGGTESQFDESTRCLLRYSHNGKDGLSKFDISSNYSSEYLWYRDTLSHVDSRSHFNRFQVSTFYTWQAGKKMNIEAGSVMLYDQANADGYNISRHQYRMELPLNVAINGNKRNKYSLIIRPQAIDFSKLALNAVGGYAFDITRNKAFVFILNGGRNHNFPTLNDLYWKPGGNPDLKPEQAWMAESGLSYSVHHKRSGSGIVNSTLDMGANVFSNLIDDYILWQPSSFGYWTAQNLRKVWARGMELSLSVNHYLNVNQQIGLSTSYSYTRSSNEKAANQYDNSVGKQLIYVTENVANTIVYYRTGLFKARLIYQYTGIRYTPDAFLEAYALWNLGASYTFNMKTAKADLEIKCNNILNENYQAIAYRAMPGRWFEISLRFFLK